MKIVNLKYLFFLCIVSFGVYAQQATELDPKFLKLPRYFNLTAINTAIPTPSQGMMVYNKATSSVWQYNGAAWIDTGNGGGVVAPLNLLYNNTVQTSTATGVGNAGVFYTNSASNSDATIYSSTIGLGSAGYFWVNNASNSAAAINAVSNGIGETINSIATGTGSAGRFFVNNTSNNAPAVKILTNGGGNGLNVSTTGGGFAGEFSIQNATNIATAFQSSTNGLGQAGEFLILNPSNIYSALSARTNGSGIAILGSTTGIGSAAQFNISNVSNNASALYSFTLGTGSASQFEIINSANTNPAITVSTNGTGKGLNVSNNSNTNATAYLLNNNATGLALETSGGLKFGGTNVGTPAAGKVLTATDADGNATWQAPSVVVPLIIGASSGTTLAASSNTGIAASFTSTSGYALITSAGNVGIGTSTPTAKLEVAGYTKLGDAPNSPAIKMIELTETTSSSNSGYSAGVTHGLDASKIISISVIVYEPTGQFYIPPAYDDNPQLKYNYYYNATKVTIKNQASSCASGSHICNKTAKILITYKQ